MSKQTSVSEQMSIVKTINNPYFYRHVSENPEGAQTYRLVCRVLAVFRAPDISSICQAAGDKQWVNIWA